MCKDKEISENELNGIEALLTQEAAPLVRYMKTIRERGPVPKSEMPGSRLVNCYAVDMDKAAGQAILDAIEQAVTKHGLFKEFGGITIHGFIGAWKNLVAKL